MHWDLCECECECSYLEEKRQELKLLLNRIGKSAPCACHQPFQHCKWQTHRGGVGCEPNIKNNRLGAVTLLQCSGNKTQSIMI